MLHILYLNGGDPRMGFLVPFLGSIFDLFLDSALLVRDVFHGVLCDWTPVFGPFLDRFFTVHFIALLSTFGPVDLFGGFSPRRRSAALFLGGFGGFFIQNTFLSAAPLFEIRRFTKECCLAAG